MSFELLKKRFFSPSILLLFIYSQNGSCNCFDLTILVFILITNSLHYEAVSSACTVLTRRQLYILLKVILLERTTSLGSELSPQLLGNLPPINFSIMIIMSHRHISKHSNSPAKCFRDTSINYGHEKGHNSTNFHHNSVLPHQFALSMRKYCDSSVRSIVHF